MQFLYLKQLFPKMFTFIICSIQRLVPNRKVSKIQFLKYTKYLVSQMAVFSENDLIRLLYLQWRKFQTFTGVERWDTQSLCAFAQLRPLAIFCQSNLIGTCLFHSKPCISNGILVGVTNCHILNIKIHLSALRTFFKTVSNVLNSVCMREK